ncbi:hypothetical protein Ddye_020813 [Dipteronia dyeriana]|uniref:Galactose oxidase-like Early set domain-containing protein n=1 Tax=Dipteronia dyeriana TaxID=168575 RepID=A0AAD9WWX7_9ROSI|nr:hypothetical protein Ddye_020813 [Dipteronia dyeriana]
MYRRKTLDGILKGEEIEVRKTNGYGLWIDEPSTMIETDTWCSSGGLTIDGNLVSTGGYRDVQTLLDICPLAKTAIGRNTQQLLQSLDGMQHKDTSDNLSLGKNQFFRIENNLYPFVHLAPDGNLFIFANNRSMLFNPAANNVHEYPALYSVSHNYPSSGMSVLLPIKLYVDKPKDYGRLSLMKPNAVWKKEMMPSPSVMGNMTILPTGDVFMINGAKTKTGSNTNNGYLYDVKYPTELRVEKLSPLYLNPELTKLRQEIVVDTSNKVTMFAPAFTTHGIYMNQRLLMLGTVEVINNVWPGIHSIIAAAPPSGKVAPPRYYLLYVVYKGAFGADMGQDKVGRDGTGQGRDGTGRDRIDCSILCLVVL